MRSTVLTTLAFLAAAWISSSDAEVHVSCPGVFGELKCPGQEIDDLKIEYGDKTDANCNAPDQPATVSPNNCFDPIMEARFISHCRGLSHCILPKPNTTLFTCDKSPDNFIQYTYTCKDPSPGQQVAKACQGDSVQLKCEQGSISIEKVLFGRVDPDTCTATSSTRLYCTSYGAEGVVKDHCNGKTECEIKAVSDYLGCTSHCDDLPKYLLVKYVCA